MCASLVDQAEQWMIPCTTKLFLGFDCPGCGLQRSILFLLKGEFWEAFKMYPAIYPLLLLLLTLLGRRWIAPGIYTKSLALLAYSAAAAILINYILKFL